MSSAEGARLIEAVVVAYESGDVLPACLDELQREGVPALVVDNASCDRSAEIAREARARVIARTRNEGYGRANNTGAAASDAEWLLVVNPDITLEPGAVAALLAAADRYPEAGMLAPRVMEPSGRFFFQSWSLLAPYLANPGRVPCRPEGDCCAPFLSGACFMIRRELFVRLGGFDPKIFLFYEDDDLCRRVADAGHALVHVHEAVARHVRGGSSAPAPGRVFRSRWHQAWSRAYVSRKYGLPLPGWGSIAVSFAKAAGAALLLQRRLVERYGGSAAGALAFRRGRTALEREGLNASDRP